MRRGGSQKSKITGIPKQHEAGGKVPELARQIGVSTATNYARKSKSGGMEVSDAQKLKGPGG
jgi:putative transposase